MKVASRYLLPLEFFFGLTMVAWGISGGIARGFLYQVLQRIGDNRSWLITLCAVGGIQMIWTAIEWFYGREWPEFSSKYWPPSVYLSTLVRACLAVVAGCVWLYVCKLLLDVDGMAQVTVLAVLAPSSFLFCFGVLVENLKVCHALNPRTSTSTLHFHR